MPAYELKYHSTCNSSYFSGSSLPVIQVLVDGNSTLGYVKESLLNEQYLPEDTDYDAYRLAVENFFSSYHTPEDIDLKFNPFLDVPTEEEWDDYDCYAHFVLVTLED